MSANTDNLMVRPLAISVGLLLVCVVIGCQPKTKQRRQVAEFDSARNRLIRGEYDVAASGFQQFLKATPNDPLASRASFLLAKCHLGLGNLDAAATQFEATRQQYPDSEEAHKSRYKLGVVSLLRGEREAALTQFRSLSESPTGVLAAESTAMVRFLEDAEEAR